MIRGILPPLRRRSARTARSTSPPSRRTSRSTRPRTSAAVLVLGSNGEAQSLDEEEKLALVRAARARVPDRTVLVGTGLESTRATIALTRKVADLGADAVLVLTPHYYKSQMTADALRAHFEAVADASSIPVLLYSVPAFTGLTWPAGLAAALAAASADPRDEGVERRRRPARPPGRVRAAPLRRDLRLGARDLSRALRRRGRRHPGRRLLRAASGDGALPGVPGAATTRGRAACRRRSRRSRSRSRRRTASRG